MASPRPQKIIHTIYTPFMPDFCNKIGQEQSQRGAAKTGAIPFPWNRLRGRFRGLRGPMQRIARMGIQFEGEPK